MGKSEGVNTTVSTFEDLQVARDWIALIEGEPGRIREQDIYPRIKAWSEGFKPPEVLEIGCGQGICSQQLSSAARQYTGVELSVPLLARAQQLYSGPERKFILGSALALPFPTGRFAGAFSVTVWFLLSDIKQASRELSRILMPGGQFLILTANPQGYANWTSRYTHSKIEGRRFEGRVTRV